MSPASKNIRTVEDPMFDQFLTFKLDLIKSEMISQANIAYKSAYGLDVRLLRVLRLICDEPGITATAVKGQTLLEKTVLSTLSSREREQLNRIADKLVKAFRRSAANDF